MEGINNYNMQSINNILGTNTTAKIIQGLHNQINQYDYILHHPLDKNHMDYNNDRLSPWDQSNRAKLKIDFSEIKKKIQKQVHREIKTNRSDERRNKIFNYTNFQKLYKKNEKDQQSKKYEIPNQQSNQIVENKLEGLDKNQTVYIRRSKQQKSQIKFPPACKTNTLQLITPIVNHHSLEPKKRMKKSIMTPKSHKKQLADIINYNDIVDVALINRPQLTNRFHFFCKKIQSNHNSFKQNNHLFEGTSYGTEKLRMINLPLKLDSYNYNNESIKKQQKEQELKITKNNINNKTFFLHTKMKQQMVNNEDQFLKVYSTGKNFDHNIVDNQESANKTYTKAYAKKRKSRIFSLILNI